jgi:hypothetical protein
MTEKQSKAPQQLRLKSSVMSETISVLMAILYLLLILRIRRMRGRLLVSLLRLRVWLLGIKLVVG